MKENDNYTASCDEQGHILVNMFNDAMYEIHDKETALQLAQSILSAVGESWPDEYMKFNDKVYIAIKAYDDDCNKCDLHNNGCIAISEMNCLDRDRKDGRNIYWKVKE